MGGYEIASNLLSEIEVETVGELRKYLASLPYDMPVTDAVGELLCIRIYDVDGVATMEVA